MSRFKPRSVKISGLNAAAGAGRHSSQYRGIEPCKSGIQTGPELLYCNKTVRDIHCSASDFVCSK